MRPSWRPKSRKQQAQRKFAEAADAFTNGVYEQSDSLKPVADKLKLEIRTAKNVHRQPHTGSARAMLANPKFLSALFCAGQHREEAQHRSGGDRAEPAGRRRASCSTRRRARCRSPR